jgi:DNA-binding MarR family transcriptional regulator
VHVFLTEEGRRLYGEIYPRVAAINREIVATLSEAEREVLDSVVDTLQAEASRMVAAYQDLPPAVDGAE